MRWSRLKLLPLVVLCSSAAADEGGETRGTWDLVSARYATSRSEPLAPVREAALSSFGLAADPDDGVVHIDESGATFRLEAPPHDGDQVVPIMGPDRMRDAMMAAQDDPVLYGTFRDAAQDSVYPVLPVLEMFGHQSKLLNDGLYAAVELRLEIPVGEHWPGKQPFLLELSRALADDAAGVKSSARTAYEAAAVFVGTAYLIGGGEASDLPAPALHDRMREQRAEFEQTPLRAKPVGFYTWNDELARIFTRDRALMRPFDPSVAEELRMARALADTLDRHPELAQQLRWMIDLQSGMTSPPDGTLVLGLADDVPDDDIHLLPPSRNREAEFIDSRGGMAAVAGDSMQVLIDAIKAGELSLQPSADDGWYAHQQYALEILLRLDDGPEGVKIFPNKGYTRRLDKAFASMFAMNRETHVKVLSLPAIGAPAALRIDVRPEFTVEPIPTYYLRTARAYRFLRTQVLHERFGAGWEELIPLGVEPVDDPVALATALGEMEAWFYGLYLVASLDIGVTPQLLPEEIVDPSGTVTSARERLASLGDSATSTDPLWDRDIRFMVPMGQTPTGELVAWTVLGISQLELTVSYGETPVVTVPPVGVGRRHIEVFEEQKYTLLVPEFAEVILPADSAPLDREEFRALCDLHPRRSTLEPALRGAVGAVEDEPRSARTGCGCAAATSPVPRAAFVVLALLCVWGWLRRDGRVDRTRGDS